MIMEKRKSSKVALKRILESVLIFRKWKGISGCIQREVWGGGGCCKLKRIYLRRIRGEGVTGVTESLIFIGSLFFPIHERPLCALRLIFCQTETKTEETEKQDGRLLSVFCDVPYTTVVIMCRPTTCFSIKQMCILLTDFTNVFLTIVTISNGYLSHKLNKLCKGNAVCSL